ncbi:hypothetical protein [Ideonella sp.]|uniref:hypothetical protein n=1 Tax=Ideonella sp. TaxID=1929293 RepID=UPI002D7EE528|nr:hypothetical protein [Ideonella sp.]
MKTSTRSSVPAPPRIDPLRNALLATVDALHRRRADLVSESLIDAYVAAFWMEWAGGTLKLTETGQNICKQLRAAARVA